MGSIFAANFKIKRSMEQNKEQLISTTTADGIHVKMYTREPEVEKRLLRGRVLLDSDEKSLLFAQNEKRKNYSKEIMRTDHGRLVRRPDGLYTFTFSCLDADETNLQERLLAELRNASRTIKSDRKKQVVQKKKEEGGERA